MTKVECGDSEDLINFANIDCEDFTQCASYLVSLDGSEGRLSKPYKMSKVAEYADINIDSLLFSRKGTTRVDYSRIMGCLQR